MTGPFEDTPATGVRKVIAARLLESKQTLPHAYLTRDVRLDALQTLRAQLAQSGAKASVNDLVVKAAALALKACPQGAGLEAGAACDVAVAVAVPGGLMTPIVRGADRLSLAEVSAGIRALAARARDGKLQPSEYTGGSLSVTNLGMYPVDSFAAILNPPQAAILAVGRAQPRVELVGGAPVAWQALEATLTYDAARVQPGDAAALLAAFSDAVEQPAGLVG